MSPISLLQYALLWHLFYQVCPPPSTQTLKKKSFVFHFQAVPDSLWGSYGFGPGVEKATSIIIHKFDSFEDMWISKNCTELVLKEEIIALPLPAFKALLRSQDIKAKSECTVFAACICWLEVGVYFIH